MMTWEQGTSPVGVTSWGNLIKIGMAFSAWPYVVNHWTVVVQESKNGITIRVIHLSTRRATNVLRKRVIHEIFDPVNNLNASFII